VDIANRGPHSFLEGVGLTVKRGIGLTTMLTGGTVIRTSFVQSVCPREEIAAIWHQPETEFKHAQGHRHRFTFTLIHGSFSDSFLERDHHEIRINHEDIDQLTELYRSHEAPGFVGSTTRFCGIHYGPLPGMYSFVLSGGRCHV